MQYPNGSTVQPNKKEKETKKIKDTCSSPSSDEEISNLP
jgi:hypothetical protein